MTALRRALVVLFAASCVLSAPNTLSAQELTTARAFITATKFWNGKEGAACMVDLLRSRAPQFVYRIGTFQDFDVVFPVVEIASGARLSRLIVISAPEYMLRSASYPFSGLEAVLSGQQRYFYDLGSKDVPSAVLEIVIRVARRELEQTCGVFQPPLHGVGVCSCILSPDDFVMLDPQAVLPLLKPAPLTPVDIR